MTTLDAPGEADPAARVAPTAAAALTGELRAAPLLTPEIAESIDYRERLAADLADAQRLQQISTRLIQEDDVDALYEHVLEAAKALMRSDMASMQILDAERGELQLIAWKGFAASSAAYWEWVGAGSGSTCGEALQTGARIIVDDVESPTVLYDARDLDAFRASGIRGVQSTPLVSRTGQLLGMISTHWRRPHKPDERELRLFDVLARQAADLIERKRAETALAESARQKDALYRFAERLQAADSRAQIYESALDAIADALRCERASVLLFDGSGVMRFVAWRGLSDAYRSVTEGHSPWRAHDPKPTPVLMKDIASADLSDTLRATVRAEGIAALAFIPLIARGRLIGKFMVYFDAPHEFTHDEVELAQTIARLLAAALDRKRADEELRRNEIHLRELIDALPAAIYTTDAQGRLTHFNPAAVELSGRTPELGTDRWCVSWKLFHPDGAPMRHDECPMAVAITENRLVRNAEAILERPDGSRRWFTPYPTPMRDENGEVTGAINMLVDITERKHVEETLKEADRRKDEFLAMLAHELRNPLAPITNAVHLLRRARTDDPVQQQAHAIIDRQTSRLTRLVDDLLEVSRITTGRIQLHIERIDLRGVIERALESTRELIDQHRHTLQIATPSEPMWLYADAARLEQVLVNLLNNAAKYTNDGGRIALAARLEGKQAVLSVRDTGIGIEPELLPRIFDLFTQAERTLDRSQGGLGIGLSLVQRLIAMHGGSVEAKSVLGQGSEFIVRLPALGAADNVQARAAAESMREAAGSLPIVIVDDNIDAAQSLGMLLEASGHSVRVALSADAALRAIEEHQPRVVFLDIGLPEMDGYEVARRVRERHTDRAITLVAMTGYGQASDRTRSRDAGFDEHLVKPARIEVVEQLLAQAAQ